MTEQFIFVDQIRTDGGTQPRHALDMVVVSEYATDMRNGDKFPPISVVFDGEFYWPWDGFHRIAGARQAERKEIKATVTQGTVEDARWLSLSANKDVRGLRRSNEDKRRAVEMALVIKPKMSDRAIAEHCGVSQPFVGSVRVEAAASDNRYQMERTATRGGKDYTINTTNIGKKPEPDNGLLELSADPTHQYEEDQPAPKPQSTGRMWDDLLQDTLKRVIAIQNCDVPFAEMVGKWDSARKARATDALRRFCGFFESWIETLEENQNV